MPDKPELIVFSQNLLGGGASFHRNMLANFPRDFFAIKCIYLDPTSWGGARALDIQLAPSDVIFSYADEPAGEIAKRLSALIPNTPGVVIANLETELISLDLHAKPKKTVYFICHDAGFIPLTVKYKSIIDLYITHNITVYGELATLMPERKNDIHFIQHGVSVRAFDKSLNRNRDLNIVFLARHHAFKGIYDLPVIDDLLVKEGIKVQWMILGDGPERGNLVDMVADRPNFRFSIPKTPEDVIEELKKQDVFILPSRSDGLPVALLEAMSVGCVPVLANFSDGIKKVVTDDIGFVVAVGDNLSFAGKIRTLSEDRDLLGTLSRNCVEKVKQEFDIKKQAAVYYNLYKRYPELKKRQSSTMRDHYRRANYNPFLNKVFNILRALRHKIGLNAF